MEITFLGVGEACDENLPNTSILIQDRGFALLDCGFSVPHRFFKLVKDPDLLDMVWISHFHGDHYFGIPLLLLRFWEMNRTKSLYLVGQKGLKYKIETIMDLSYPSFRDKLNYKTIFVELDPLQEALVCGFKLKGVFSQHPQKNMALKLKGSSGCVYYSGDGKPSLKCVDLARKSELIIHECFMIRGSVEGHGSVEMAIDFAQKCGVKRLVVVHMQRDERKRFRKDTINTKGIELIVPLPGDKISI